MNYCKLEPDVVIEACDKWLHVRNETLRNYRDGLVRKKMKPTLFRPRGLTYEKAEAILKSDIWSSYVMVALNGKYWANSVTELRSLALVAKTGSTLVYIDSEMAETLEEYLVK